MKLNHPGIYRIIGEDYELLANVVGEVPCLRITSALLMNDLVQKGKFTVLEEESIEIQQVLLTPEKFIFLEYEYSEICELPSIRKSINGTKIPDLSDAEYRDFTNRYVSDVFITKRGICATKAYIMRIKGWSLAQVSVLLMKIAKDLKKRTICQPNVELQN